MLHGGVDQQALGEGVDHGARDDPLGDVAFGAQEFGVGEQYLGHAGDADEIDQVSFRQSAADGAEFAA